MLKTFYYFPKRNEMGKVFCLLENTSSAGAGYSIILLLILFLHLLQVPTHWEHYLLIGTPHRENQVTDLVLRNVKSTS